MLIRNIKLKSNDQDEISLNWLPSVNALLLQINLSTLQLFHWELLVPHLPITPDPETDWNPWSRFFLGSLQSFRSCKPCGSWSGEEKELVLLTIKFKSHLALVHLLQKLCPGLLSFFELLLHLLFLLQLHHLLVVVVLLPVLYTVHHLIRQLYFQTIIQTYLSKTSLRRLSLTLRCSSHLRSASTKTAFQAASVVPYSGPGKDQ